MTISRAAKASKPSNQTESNRRRLLFAIVSIISCCISSSEAFKSEPKYDQSEWGSDSSHPAGTCLEAASSSQAIDSLASQDSQPGNNTKLAIDQQLINERNETELPELSSSQSSLDETHLLATDKFFNHADRMHDSLSVGQFGLMALVARGQSIVYADLFMHKFDNPEIMRRSAGVRVDNQLCLKQLASLVQRADRQQVEKFASRDVNLFRLMDTWGRMPAGLLLGNVFFHGAHDECLRVRLDMPDGPQASTRYCVLHLRHKHWPRLDKHDLLSLKTGVCLPAACDSSNYKDKFELLMRLAEYQMRRHELGEVKFESLYCLPDEDSAHQQIWPHHPKTALVLALLFAWLLALVWATWRHHTISKQQAEKLHADLDKRRKSFGLTNMNVGDDEQAEESIGSTPASDVALVKVYELLSITNNLKLLFNTTKETSLMEAGKRLKSAESSDNKEENNNHEESSNEHEEKSSSSGTGKLVDLGCIEGVKVVAMCYVIMGHVLMCLLALASNGKEVVLNSPTAFLMANLVPAFAVNSFFTITGLLTSYLMLKQNQSYCFITSPGKWLAFILYRYLRIAPMYALAVLYCKHLARFTGSGPLWDYATSSLSQRRACELESWFYTLTFTSNFIPPMQHCIPGGWYLSNDFQFFLVTPIFLLALYKSPRFGQWLLVAGAVAGYLAGFHSIFASQASDLRPIANFAAHGFKTYVSHLSYNYTQPQYRIPAYLIGLLVGFKLYQYEQAHEGGSRASAGWSDRFKRSGPTASLVLILLCCVTPFVGTRLTFTKWGARFMVSLITPSYHVLFALAVGLYLLLATTGHGNERLNKLLSAPQWKPLARLSLCAVLVNVETINFIVQGDRSQHAITNRFHLVVNCLSIVATYLVATFVCVLFEAPIRGSLNLALTSAIERVAAAKKRRSLASNVSALSSRDEADASERKKFD